MSTIGKTPERLRSMTKEEIEKAARGDPDAQPLTATDFTRLKRTPQVRVIRTALRLTQEEFGARYNIPLGTLRDWEQGRSEPDAPTRAYINLIARDPENARAEARPAFRPTVIEGGQSPINLDRLRKIAGENNRYEQQINRLTQQSKQISCIEQAVSEAMKNVDRDVQAFVIYGEPQSGKTEMMICLTAKLIDRGFDVVIHLLNDSVQLLQQNLDRFQRSGLAPAAKNFSDLLDPSISLNVGQHVIFCKKNAKDLARLVEKTRAIQNKIVIDDEADFATPNSKVNQGTVTAINDLVSQLIGKDGRYIGVTATPARLDLNNTFDNDNERWVNFPPHLDYTGQDIFFPVDATPAAYRLELLPPTGDSPRYLREALFRFMATVGFINLNSQREENFSMLVHTSGKKIDHRADKKPIEDVLQALSDVGSPKFAPYVQEIKRAAERLFGPENADRILDYVVQNGTRANIIVMNSERDKNVDFKSATSPAALFTMVIGGNIVSRGVTFENLLSMFFTRDAKHKIQQDTYIQRARMFGSRKAHLSHFELTIPQDLYVDWHRCFVFHRLALEAIKAGLGSPVWLADNRISAVAAASIDRTNVSLDKGEMSFPPFNYVGSLEQVINSSDSPLDRLLQLQSVVGKEALPDYLLHYVRSTSPFGARSIALHPSHDISEYKDAEGLDKQKIERRRGFIGTNQMQKDKYPEAVHHFKIFYNAEGRGRVFYKFDGSIKFIKNLKNAA
jgi:DNA-binding transcriptional regulator YiaG